MPNDTWWSYVSLKIDYLTHVYTLCIIALCYSLSNESLKYWTDMLYEDKARH